MCNSPNKGFDFFGSVAEWSIALVLFKSSAMARNPIVESAKFGGNPLKNASKISAPSRFKGSVIRCLYH